MKSHLIKIHALLNKTRKLDFLAPFMLRMYLVPVFWMAGTKKVEGFEGIVEWFGNTEWGLGLPFPFLMAILATATEFFGAIALFFGVAVRWFSIPLMITMIVAAGTVHWDNGWQAITDPSAPFATERVIEASNKLAIVKEVLQEHTNYDYITSSGSVVMLNNGIEFSVTYFIMLLALLFMGAGRYVSVDYWVERALYKEQRALNTNY
ncbi:DoxX family protein [Colwellia sp. MSW7]|uniref:DoxX family protein n=1 Tax=Colwellia maritima TaxID=2912588 RepID=A0ABS9X2F8_9GAMM|nr:DoxX family protein [Colwellia maritima]MCI2284408.1 DoxX family protein [Colwellia maritima]